MAVPSLLPEKQEGRREKLLKVLAELKIELIFVRECIRDQLLSVLAFGMDADDGGHTTLIEHRIQTGNSGPFRERSRPLP